MQSNRYTENKVDDSDKTISRLASIGQIAAGIAHEVRNPLTAVKGFLQLMQKESPHAYLDIAGTELDRAIDTLQDLLQVSKPDLEDEAYVTLNLCSELESLLYLFQDQVYQVKIVKNFKDTEVTISGKRNQLKKAFFNLIKNAFESIRDKGVITVEHYLSGEYVLLSIIDTGVGIPEEKLEMLGTPFFTTKDNGTGMGLTQVFSAIYQHGATIDVKSKIGVGTTFTIKFPLQKKRIFGVRKLDQVKYVENQSFKEFLLHNQERFNQLVELEAQTAFDYMSNHTGKVDKQTVWDGLRKLAMMLVEDRQHEMVLFAKEGGKEGAKTGHPLILILELLHAFRHVYWEFLYNYHKNVELETEEFFQVERLTNITLDTYITHYFTSYMEYKEELLRAQREIIDDLTVSIIPLSSTMAVLPIVGTMDTYRAKKIQEKALLQISELKLQRIIIDLSGVAYMDTAVVGHLFRIVEGIGLLGCKAIVTGIRPEIANTMIEMGIKMTEKLETKGSLQQALEDYGLQ